MTFAAITPALIVGSMAERMKFSAVMLFIALWVTLVYFPIAHMVWYWAGPAATVAAAKALAAAAPATPKRPRRPQWTRCVANAGLAFQWGALDFAGGTVVHINAGIAGLMGALIVGKRVGFGREAMPPHSLTMTLIGASLLWVGWFGFNAGSALEARRHRGTGDDQHVRRHGSRSAGLDAGREDLQGQAQPARRRLRCRRRSGRGDAGLRLCRTDGCHRARHRRRLRVLFFCSAIKNALGYDDALDVFGVHCVGGILGAIGTGFLAAPSLGGTGVFDYTTGKVGDYDMMAQVITQCKTVALTLVWSGVGSPSCSWS